MHGRDQDRDQPRFPRGMSTSIRQGLFGPGPEYPGLFYLLGDQPGIGKEVVNRLIREFEGHFPEKSIIVPAYRGSQGHPVLFSAKYRKEASELRGTSVAGPYWPITRRSPDGRSGYGSGSGRYRYTGRFGANGPCQTSGGAEMTLAEAFHIQDREIISLVGGGENHPSFRPGE